MGGKEEKRGIVERFFASNQLAVRAGVYPILFSMLICPIISYQLHWSSVIQTHCEKFDVKNFVPSMSAVIGNEEPEKYIWRMCITISIVSFFISYTTIYLHRKYTENNLHALNFICYFAKIVENISLMVLSCVSSRDHTPVHVIGFVGWLFGGLTGIVTKLILDYNSKNGLHPLKTFFGITYLTMFCVGPYFLHQHNAYCKQNAYSFAASCEWVMILCNKLFDLYNHPLDAPPLLNLSYLKKKSK